MSASFAHTHTHMRRHAPTLALHREALRLHLMLAVGCAGREKQEGESLNAPALDGGGICFVRCASE